MSMPDTTPMSEPPRRFEVFTGAGRRRIWSEAEKAAIVADALTPDLMRNVMRGVSQYLLPHDIQDEEKPGYEIMPSLGKLFHALTTLGRRAAREYHQPFRPSPAPQNV